MTIRDTTSYPNGTEFVLTLANHFKNPNLGGISNAERFTLAVITIGFNKACHYFNSLTCSLGTLKADVDKRTIINKSSSLL